MIINERRLLLPFVDGVSVEAIDYALSFSKAVHFSLVALALIPQPVVGNVRAEYIQQANDFLETVESRAEMHDFFIEKHQYFSRNASISILDALSHLNCQGMIVPFQNNVPCFIHKDAVESIQEHTARDMYFLHVPQKSKKYVFRSMQKMFDSLLHA